MDNRGFEKEGRTIPDEEIHPTISPSEDEYLPHDTDCPCVESQIECSCDKAKPDTSKVELQAWVKPKGMDADRAESGPRCLVHHLLHAVGSTDALAARCRTFINNILQGSPGEHTSLAPRKGERLVAEKGSKKEHSQAHGDPRMEAHRDGCAPGSCCSQDGKCEVDNPPGVRSSYGSVDTVSVCRSCQHLYAGNVEVVLSPACLEDHLPHPDPANPRPVSVHRPWAARK
ncbi:hypothetical protein O3P69_001617 [Scylla paramamosain]|uniref:Uncharacterized protein n=1 Tax=Scylla paramamosain TaxID=85552 RepID=A0AAW0UZ23_SCYPA